MRELSNETVAILCRALPRILAHVDPQAVRKSLRLNNAVRQTKIILQRLEKLNNGK